MTSRAVTRSPFHSVKSFFSDIGLRLTARAA